MKSAAFVLAWLSIPAANAQISQAALQGTIKDNTGAVIPGANITIKNKGTAAVRSITSDSSGQYAISNLDPAEYTLSVNYKGFKTFIVGSLTMHTAERSTLNATLELGDTSQEVTVDAAVPLLS